MVIGTPVDEHLNPEPEPSPALDACAHLRDGQLLVLRSTVYPGVTALVERLVAGLGVSTWPSARSASPRARRWPSCTRCPSWSRRAPRRRRSAPRALRPADRQVVFLAPEEAELAKLFTNTWRYIKFAAANQLYMMANDRGLDFERIRQALILDYPRAADMPGAGFAAGPCLFKDTMQLAAFNNNNFLLGHAAMLINEGLPLYVVHRLAQHDLLDDRRHPRHGLQGRVGRHPVQPQLQAQADPRVQGRGGAVHRSVRHRRPDLVSLDGCSPSATCSSSALPTPSTRPGDGHAGGRHLEPARRRGVTDLTPRVSIVMPVHNEGDHIVPVLDRLFESVSLQCEVLVVVDSAEDTTIPVLSRVPR